MSKIFCIGTFIVDIINSKVDRLPAEGETINASVSASLGGNAYSMSMNLRRLNMPEVEVYCYGQTGEDNLGDLFDVKLKTENVKSYLHKVNEKNTSCNIILQEKGKDRRYIFDEGANSPFSKKTFLRLLESIQPDVVIFGEIPSLGLVGKDFLNIVEIIKSRYHSLILLDLLVNSYESYAWMTGNWHLIDIVHCNLGEGSQITKKHTAYNMAGWFLDNGVTLAIISDGPNGCDYGYKNEVVHVDAFQADEVDATGAGDAMIAGVLTKILELQTQQGVGFDHIHRNEMKMIIRYGSACGSVAVQSIGCISDITIEKVKAVLETYE